MKRTKHLHKMWETYRAKVVPGDAGEAQVKETHLAFFSGAFALWSVLMGNASEGDSDEPTEKDEQLFDDLKHEIETFAASQDQASTRH